MGKMEVPMSSDNKVALVTGSGKRRIGWHVARALAERGYRLAIHYNRAAAEADQTVSDFTGPGMEAPAFQADFSDEHAAAALIERVRQRFGEVDVLVNCASIYGRKRLEDVTPADVRINLEINT